MTALLMRDERLHGVRARHDTWRLLTEVLGDADDLEEVPDAGCESGDAEQEAVVAVS